MAIPDWAKGLIKEWVPNLVAEFIGVQGIKNLLRRGREKADETARKEAPAMETIQASPVKTGGLFNLSDETNFSDLLGKVEAHPDGKEKKYASKIAGLLLKFPENWQRRRFRASVGELNIDYTIKVPVKDLKEEHWENGKLKSKTDKSTETVVTRNLGVQVLISLAQYSEPEMLEICKASGIMDSDFESIKKAWTKVEAWANTQGPAIVKSINGLTEQLELSASEKLATKKPIKPKRPYPGFFKAFLGLK